MKSISTIFKDCAKKSGLNTYMYARLGEANYLMDKVKQYPVLLRLFNEKIGETHIPEIRRRTTTLYFCDALGKADPDTETEVMPVVEKMETRAFDFLSQLRKEGVDVSLVSDVTPYYAKFDAFVAGVYLTVTLTYNIC